MLSQKYLPQDECLSKRAIEILHLLAEGMSDREIAQQLVMTINTVKWYNRQIYSTFGVGSRTEAIAHARKRQLLDNDPLIAPALKFVPHLSKHNLPVKTTHFIGREHELEVVKGLLDKAHLLTLTGLPGVGKTRLALQAASEIADSFQEGVYFVSLAPVFDPALVIDSIATTLGVNVTRREPLIETLKRFLHKSQTLLILDNFEHLLSAAILVSELLSAAPQLRVLVTSRAPLHIYGEHEYAVPPMNLSHPAHLDPHTLASCESISLFMQQVRSVRPNFELIEENALDIAQICDLLEGLPLAIELAAVRLKVLTPRSLLAWLKMNRLDTLTGGAYDLPVRQQTLRNAIEWSYNLLDEGEKVLFARLAVFQEACSLEAIEAICGEALPIDVFDGLTSLVDKSLIEQTASPKDELRFIMLETIREYAIERLEESNETEMITRRYTEYFVRFPQYAETKLYQTELSSGMELLETKANHIHFPGSRLRLEY